MNRELDLIIAKEIFGWNVYEPVAPDGNGENAGQVLVPYKGYSDWLFSQGYSYPPKGIIAEGFHTPTYCSDYRNALEVAKKVNLPTPAHQLPTNPEDLVKLAYGHFKAKHVNRKSRAVWIKASERLPAPGFYNAKKNGRPFTLDTTKAYKKTAKEYWDNVEWLDESGTVNNKVEELRVEKLENVISQIWLSAKPTNEREMVSWIQTAQKLCADAMAEKE